jgi:hypothetical protein
VAEEEEAHLFGVGLALSRSSICWSQRAEEEAHPVQQERTEKPAQTVLQVVRAIMVEPAEQPGVAVLPEVIPLVVAEVQVSLQMEATLLEVAVKAESRFLRAVQGELQVPLGEREVLAAAAAVLAVVAAAVASVEVEEDVPKEVVVAVVAVLLMEERAKAMPLASESGMDLL